MEMKYFCTFLAEHIPGGGDRQERDSVHPKLAEIFILSTNIAHIAPHTQSYTNTVQQVTFLGPSLQTVQ